MIGRKLLLGSFGVCVLLLAGLLSYLAYHLASISATSLEQPTRRSALEDPEVLERIKPGMNIREAENLLGRWFYCIGKTEDEWHYGWRRTDGSTFEVHTDAKNKILKTHLWPKETGERPNKPLVDYTQINLNHLDVAQTKDPKTGFVVGGKNPTALIRNLTEINGRTIADLEKDMRPKVLSTAGFLGQHERLLQVLATDNDVVINELGLTHQELAKPLRAMLVFFGLENKEFLAPSQRFMFKGRRLQVDIVSWFDSQESPFLDGTSTSIDVTVTNLDTGKTINYSALVPLMIERYGFYEGKGTSYRVEPRQIVEVLDFLRKPR